MLYVCQVPCRTQYYGVPHQFAVGDEVNSEGIPAAFLAILLMPRGPMIPFLVPKDPKAADAPAPSGKVPPFLPQARGRRL